MMRYDVIVIGGGVVGAATAENVARRGRRTLLLDQFAPGHKRGSSHGDGRIIRYAYDKPFYIDLSQLAYPAWEALGERAGEQLITLTGGWDGGPAGHPYLDALEANFRRRDIPYERLSAAESNERFPHFYLPPGSEAIYQPQGGVAFADRIVHALWRLAAAAGAETVTGTRVADLQPADGGVTVTGEDGRTWHGRRLVLAAGGWAPGWLARLGHSLSLRVTQEQVAHFPARETAVDHRLGHMPIFVDWHVEPNYYGLPQIDIPGVKVGWHLSGRPVDPDHPHPLDHAHLAQMQAYVRRRLPGLDPEPAAFYSCLYTSTPDEDFILDRLPNHPQIIVGSGFSGHGFKFGPTLGHILADLALDETPPLDLTPFALARLIG